MIKKITFPLLITVIVIQLVTSVSMICYGQNTESDVLQYGAEYTIDININSIMDDKVIFSPGESDLWIPLHNNEYVLLTIGEDGKAYCSGVTKERPDENVDYIKPTKRNTNKLYSYKVDYDGEIYSIYQRDACVTVKVYKGNIEVTGLYIDGMLVEEWLVAYENGVIPDLDDEILPDKEILWEE